MVTSSIVFYKRSLLIPSIKERYDKAVSLMRLLYFFKKKQFSRSTLSYNPTDSNFIPETTQFFWCFYEAAEVMVENNIQPNEYLSALVELRKDSPMKVALSETMMSSWFSLKAIEIYIYNKRLVKDYYEAPSLDQIKDPEEEEREQTKIENQTWKTLRECSVSEEQTLEKIFSSNIRLMFRQQFFDNMPEFLKCVESGKLISTPDGYVWKY